MEPLRRSYCLTPHILISDKQNEQGKDKKRLMVEDELE
jgi:hypothetical protein